MTPTTRKRSSTRHHEQHDLIGDHLFFFPRVILSLLLLNTPLKMKNFFVVSFDVTFRLFCLLDTTTKNKNKNTNDRGDLKRPLGEENTREVQRGRHHRGFEKVSRGANRNQAGENTVLMMIFVFDVMMWCRTICCGVAFCELDLEFGCREEEEELSLSFSLSLFLFLSLSRSLSLCVCVCVRTAAKRAFNVCLVKLKFLLLFSPTNKQTNKNRIQKWYTIYKDHITLDDYEVKDGSNLELYYN